MRFTEGHPRRGLFPSPAKSSREGPGRARYRVRVARLGPARGLTHLAQIERLRRAVAESGLPAVLQKRRKSPRPKLAFGPAISMGYESAAEYFDLELDAVLAPPEVSEALSRVLKEGLEVRSVRRIPQFYPSLDASINVVRYDIRGPFPEDSGDSLGRFLERPEIVIEKLKEGGARVERIDAKPLIIEMRLASPELLELSLRFGPNRTVKPEALLKEWLGRPEAELGGFRILRKELLSETSRGELLAP
jgi:radical SAM-linked protein